MGTPKEPEKWQRYFIMRIIPLLKGWLLGALSSSVIAALSVLGSQLAGLPRLSYTIFDWLARVLPGDLLTMAIDALVFAIDRLEMGPTSSVAKFVEQSVAVVLFVFLGAIFGAILAGLDQYSPGRLIDYGMVGGLLFAFLLVWILFSLPSPPAGLLVSSLWVVFVCALWGAVLGRLIRIAVAPQSDQPARSSRRQFLYLVGIGSLPSRPEWTVRAGDWK